MFFFSFVSPNGSEEYSLGLQFADGSVDLSFLVESVDCPWDPQEAKPFAEGSTAIKDCSQNSVHWVFRDSSPNQTPGYAGFTRVVIFSGFMNFILFGSEPF